MALGHDTDHSHDLTRRGAITLAAATATAALAVPTSAAADPRRSPDAPETVSLPTGIRPEGITSGPGTTYYVGSLADGRIVRGDLLTGSGSVLLQGAAGRQLRGLYRDARSGLVWAAGNIGVPDTAGSEARVWAVDGASGAVVTNVLVRGARFLNDLVATPDAVWVTDSRVDRLTRIAVNAGGLPTGAPLEFRTLGGAWPAFTGSTNANGIRELPDGSLVLNNSSTGGLFRVDTATGHATAIPVKGGPGLVGGDGLEIDGTTLYDVRGSGQHEVSVLQLEASASGWSALWRGARTDDTLDVPSTATLAGGWLWAVNARFGIASPGTAPFWVTRLPAR